MKYSRNQNQYFKKQKQKRINKRKEKQMEKKSNKKTVIIEDYKKRKQKNNKEKQQAQAQSRQLNSNKNNKKPSSLLSSGNESNDKYDELHHEIITFVSTITPKQEDIEKREKTIDLLSKLIHSKYPNWAIKLFGSYMQGTQTYQSDLDFVIFCNKEERLSDEEMLEIIFYLLKRNKFGLNTRFIRAKVPIVKSICYETGISIDISVNKDNGCQAAEVIKRHLKIEPGLKTMIIFLKYLLKSEGLNDASIGGISSFVLFSLVFYFYQHIKKNNMEIVMIDLACLLSQSEQMDTDDEEQSDRNVQKEDKEKNKNMLNLGKFLFGFMKFYGRKFNDYDCGISLLNGGEEFYKEDHLFLQTHNLLCIENFQDPQADIGRSCYHYPIIKRFFRRTLSTLQTTQRNSNSNTKASFIKSLIRCPPI